MHTSHIALKKLYVFIELIFSPSKGLFFSFAVDHQAKAQVMDDDDDWTLPISHRPSESLNLAGVEVASVDKSIPSSNVGYKLLKMMGWKENTGLGRDGEG